MTKRLSQMASAAALTLAATTAFADIKLNDNISLGGYAVGSANYTESKPTVGTSSSTSKLDGDAYKLWSSITYGPVSGTISVYAGQSGDPVILDAYATYDVGGGTKITAGKFLSWMGYEAFDPINMTQITYAWATPQGFGVPNIPAYHSGVKVETGNDNYTVGVAVLDSVDPEPTVANGGNSKLGIEKGDGDLKNGPGFEAYYTYKGVKDLTLFAGVTYEANSGVNGAVTGNYGTDITSSAFDLWGQYVLGDTTFAAEYSYRLDDHKANADAETSDFKLGSTFGLLEVQQALDKKWAIMARVAWIGKHDNTPGAVNPSATSFTIAPTLTLTDHFSIVAEYTYSKYHDYALNTGNFVAAQVRFKF